MKKSLNTFSILLLNLFFSCSNAQNNEQKVNLSPVEFSEKISQNPTAKIIDVRTPEEFNNGHISNALNFNWNGDSFQSQIANIDKSQPVFVYCLSGGRSASAANKMRSLGFAKVFELDGGMMRWRASNLPETKSINNKPKELTKAQFNDFLRSDKLVLIDFYADWCIPCQKMKPYLEEISKEQANTVIVVRINADENPNLCKELGVDALPVLQIYKNNVLTWSNKGFITKAELIEKLK